MAVNDNLNSGLTPSDVAQFICGVLFAPITLCICVYLCHDDYEEAFFVYLALAILPFFFKKKAFGFVCVCFSAIPASIAFLTPYFEANPSLGGKLIVWGLIVLFVYCVILGIKIGLSASNNKITKESHDYSQNKNSRG